MNSSSGVVGYLVQNGGQWCDSVSPARVGSALNEYLEKSGVETQEVRDDLPLKRTAFSAESIKSGDRCLRNADHSSACKKSFKVLKYFLFNVHVLF